MGNFKTAIIFCLTVIGSIALMSAQAKSPLLYRVEGLIASDSIAKATEVLNSAIDRYKAQKDYAPLADLLYSVGKIESLKSDFNDYGEVLALYPSVLGSGSDRAVYRANIAMGLLYNDIGRSQEAYRYAARANIVAQRLRDQRMLLESEYYLGEFGMKKGDFNLLFEHIHNALQVLRDNPSIEFPLAPRVYNYQASIMHFSSKPDSANFYFKKALDHIPHLEEDPENSYYLPGTIYGNWFMVKQSEGDYTAAMEYSLRSVAYFNLFLSGTRNHPLTSRVHGNLSIAYRNIAALYNDTGNREKAKKFAQIAYRHAKANFSPNTMSYFSAMLMMGEAYLYDGEGAKALDYLKEAERSLMDIEGENYLWKAQMASVFANYYYKNGDYAESVPFFETAAWNYTRGNPEGMDQNQQYNLMNLAMAHASNHNFAQAYKAANKVYDHTLKNYGEHAFLTNEALLTLAKVAFKAKEYSKVLHYADQSLGIFEGNSGLVKMDKLYFEAKKTDILILKAKATYELLGTRDRFTLLPIAEDLNKVISLIEMRKSLITSNEELADLISDNQEGFDFAKQIHLELFGETGDIKYRNEVLWLHESSIYNRIRARLNLKSPVLSQIPDVIRNRENAVKKDLENMLASMDSYEDIDIGEYAAATSAWTGFLDSLQLNYPAYHKLKYGAIGEPISDMESKIPEETTLIRYLFIAENLYAYIVSPTQQELIPLEYNRHAGSIEKLNTIKNDVSEFSEASVRLYQMLWKPIEEKIRTPKLIIIPDQELFNLSFEILCREKITSFRDLASKGLLSKYAISYNYSLFLVDKNKKTLEFEKDFIAFAPGFNSEMKNDYTLAITDSLDLDRAYLTLLPQPFSSGLVTEFSRKFKGEAFLNTNASKTVFRQKAREHKIIHIGTHAESNNVSPELSRIVFAKNVRDSVQINDNYLYSYEIYDQDLNSNLAVLTACETGRPGYQPGEGMISLAHAFNYAGSESILTSLWQIDEKSSTQILGRFYHYMKSGLPKDEALRKAKFDYLEVAEGRTLHPQYWAGLILMGDTSPILFATSNNWIGWVLISILIGLLILFIIKKGKAFDNRSKALRN